MMQVLRNSKITTVLWTAFSLYLFNLSADSHVPNQRYQKEDLSINDQESMIEVIVEQIFGFEDTFDEYEDPDTEAQKNNQISKIDFYCQQILDLLRQQIFTISKNYSSKDLKINSLKGFCQLTTPPPKA